MMRVVSEAKSGNVRYMHTYIAHCILPSKKHLRAIWPRQTLFFLYMHMKNINKLAGEGAVSKMSKGWLVKTKLT